MSVTDRLRVDLRASDAERDRAAELLRRHHIEGRLTLEEFSDRVEQVYRARSVSDLAHALRELPAERRRSRRRLVWRRGRLPGWWLRVNGICTAIWAATSVGTGLQYFWPMWVMLGTGIPVFITACQGRRPGLASTSDAEAVVPDQTAPERDSGFSRVVSSVLFVDIVESTERAAAMGDAEWNRILSTYETRVRQEIDACGGREVFTKGDEVVAAFATPAAAVRCGCAIRACAGGFGLEVRAGVHAGEVDQQGREMRGLAMHIGQRVCAAAHPGALLVSSTVRDLLVGSNLKFTDAGEHKLKGIPDAWHLYALAD